MGHQANTATQAVARVATKPPERELTLREVMRCVGYSPAHLPNITHGRPGTVLADLRRDRPTGPGRPPAPPDRQRHHTIPPTHNCGGRASLAKVPPGLRVLP